MQGMHQTMMALMDDGTAIDRMEARITGMEAMLDLHESGEAGDRGALCRVEQRAEGKS